MDLTLYFGRCLGAVALGVVYAALKAAPNPSEHRLLFEFIAFTCSIMTGVHAWGALRRQQPWTETVEIALYGSLAVMAGFIRWGQLLEP
ncbi:MAG: hypothetical protein AAFV29_22485 [Myxococcota bacterium]